MARHQALSESAKVRVVSMRRKGLTHTQIARSFGVHPTTIGRYLRSQDAEGRMQGMPAVLSQGGPAAMERWEDDNPAPKMYAELSKKARRGLVDFPFFCSEILGEPLQGHQERWDAVDEAEVASGNRFIQINVHPRGGKTDWKTNKKGLWRLIGGGRPREFYDQLDPPLRDLRLVLVAGSEAQSDKNFEYIQARLAEHGRLVGEYGRFRQPGLPWRNSDRVLTLAGRQRLVLAGDYSLVCVGMRSHFLGRGADEIDVDDAFDLDNCTTAEAAEKNLHWLRTQVFSRLEPGGSICVLGARLPMANDPYVQIASWPAAAEGAFDDEEALEAPDGEDYPRLFHTIVQPAVLDWERRVLLCPERFTWRQMMQARALAGPEVWASTWMQQPSGGHAAIARREWIYGGTTGGTGVLSETHPGCLDNERSWGASYDVATAGLPDGAGLRPRIRVLSIDPSDRKFWAFVVEDVYKVGRDYHPVILDLDRQRHNTSSALRLMADLFSAYGFRVLVLERNIAKFLIENDQFQEFVRTSRVKVIYHDTTAASKLHKEWGMGTLADDFRFGRIRIPNADTETRWKMQYLVKEATGELQTTDCLMATWFPKYNLAGLLAMAESDGGWPGWKGSPGRHRTPPPRVGRHWAGVGMGA